MHVLKIELTKSFLVILYNYIILFISLFLIIIIGTRKVISNLTKQEKESSPNG